MDVQLRNIFFALVLALFSTSVFASDYFYDESLLDAKQAMLIDDIRNRLDAWGGGFKKLSECKAMIDALKDSNPKFLPVYVEEARYLTMLGIETSRSVEFNEKALAVLKRVEQWDDSYAKQYVLAGHVYSNLGKYDEALNALKKAGQLNTDDPWYFNNWTAVLIRQERYEEAIELAARAVESAGGNKKALLVAILRFNFLAGKTGRAFDGDFVELVFREISAPDQRLGLADRLVAHYGGVRENLRIAFGVIQRQKREAPEEMRADLSLANLILTDGYLSTVNEIEAYSKSSMQRAQPMLEKLQGQGVDEDWVFRLLSKIYFSQGDLESFDRAFVKAKAVGVSEEVRSLELARMHYVSGDYEKVIGVLEPMIDEEPAIGQSMILLKSYALFGDNTKLEEYHLNQIKNSPMSAWARGNFAGFLLDIGDTARAIKYGEMALELMDYPIARNTTGMSYLIEAAKSYSDGDVARSRQLYLKGSKFGVSSEFQRDFCGKHCKTISHLRELFEN